MFSDPLNVAIPDRSEDKVAKRKWLIDTCSEYVDKCVLESNDVSVLVTQTCELHNQHKMKFKCRNPDCNKDYVYHSGRVK